MLKHYLRFAAYLFMAVGFSCANAGAYEDFFQAVGRDDADTVQGLLQRGFDPNSRNEQGQTPLYLSQRERAVKVAQVLLANPQTRIDLPNTVGETPLMMAALRGQVDAMAQLLAKGARIDGPEAGERPGWTPLHYAASGPGDKAVQWLLERGAKVDVRSPNGTTPLMMAAQYGVEASVDSLLKQGADARLRNAQGLAAADFAQRAGRAPLAARLGTLAR